MREPKCLPEERTGHKFTTALASAEGAFGVVCERCGRYQGLDRNSQSELKYPSGVVRLFDDLAFIEKRLDA